jgi:ParB family chromosome partitioning protein
MNAQPSIIQVPLSQLRLSPRNARKTGGHDIEGLAASIAAHNLLQNLTVTPALREDKYEVVAGGRRLAAMQLLRDRGQLDAEFSVPCKLIVDDTVALEASTAENTLREAMHPADQFVAFKGMVDNGKSIDDVAAHFGVQPAIVRQRLKLANVNPKLVEVYREGGMQLDQLQALALTDDQELQRKVWFGSKETWQRRADEIRKRITKQEVGPDNPLVKFVEPSLYEAAGGPIRNDLFTGQVYYGDSSLLNTLAKNKLDAIALQEKDAGWSWVEAHMLLDYSQQSAYARSTFAPKRTKPTPEDEARTAEIEKRLKEIEAIEEASELELDDVLQNEQDALQSELELIESKREQWPAEAKAKTGVLIYLDRYEGLRIERGRLRPGQREGAATKTKGKDGKPAKAALSQDMVQRLEMHRVAAIREHIAADPAKALQLLLAHLLTKLFSDGYSESTLDIAPENQHRKARGLIDSKFADLAKSPARKAIDDRLAEWKKAGLPGKSSDIYAWLGTQSEAKRLQLLALATALTLGSNPGTRGYALAEQFGVDMTKWWTATPETFIGVVPKALLAEAVSEVAGKAEGEAVLLLKKDGAMAEAAKKLAGTGWLPKPLRGAGYKVGKPASAKAATPATAPAAKKAPAAAKKATKKAATKPVKKAAKAVLKKGAK